MKKVASFNPANFAEYLVPLCKFFNNVFRIIGRPKSSRIEDLDEIAGIMDVTIMMVSHYTIFYMKNFYNKLSLKNPKALKKCG